MRRRATYTRRRRLRPLGVRAAKATIDPSIEGRLDDGHGVIRAATESIASSDVARRVRALLRAHMRAEVRSSSTPRRVQAMRSTYSQLPVGRRAVGHRRVYAVATSRTRRTRRDGATRERDRGMGRRDREVAGRLTVCDGDMLSSVRRVPPEDQRCSHCPTSSTPRARGGAAAYSIRSCSPIFGREPESLGARFTEAVV